MELQKVVFLGVLLGSLVYLVAIARWSYQRGLMHTWGARIGLFCGFVGLAMGLYFSVGGIL